MEFYSYTLSSPLFSPKHNLSLFLKNEFHSLIISYHHYTISPSPHHITSPHHVISHHITSHHIITLSSPHHITTSPHHPTHSHRPPTVRTAPRTSSPSTSRRPNGSPHWMWRTHTDSSTSRSQHTTGCDSTQLDGCLFVCLLDWLSIYLSVCLSICLLNCLLVCLFACLLVHLFVLF